MTRDEIIEITDKQSGGALSKVLDELEYCGFIRKYNGFGKKSKQTIYQLIDNYTLFYFKFIQQNENNDEHFGQPQSILQCIVLGADWLLNAYVWHMYNK